MADTAVAQMSEQDEAQPFRTTVEVQALTAAFELAKLSGREQINAPFKRVTLIPQPEAGRMLIRSLGEAGLLTTAVEAEVEGASVTTDLTRLAGIAELAPQDGMISMSEQANGFAVKTPHGRFRLPNLDGTLHIEPQSSPTEGVVTMECALDRIRDGVRRVKHSVGNDDARYYLNGTHIQISSGSITLTATNGHRLSQEVIPGPLDCAPAEAIVPKAGIAALSSMLSERSANVRIGIGEKFAWFSVGLENGLPPATLLTRLIDGRYVETRKLIPRNEPRSALHGPGAEMRRALDYAKVFEQAAHKENHSHTPALAFQVRQGQVEARFGDQHLPLDLAITPADDEPDMIAFQYAYFRDVITALGEVEQVSIERFNDDQPYRITSEDVPSFFELIMPVKI